MLFTFVLCLWTIANVLLDYGQYSALASVEILTSTNKAGFFLGIVSVIMAYIISLYFPTERKTSLFGRLLLGVGVSVLALTLSDSVSGTFQYLDGQEVSEYAYGEYVFVAGLYGLTMIGLAVHNIRRSLKEKVTKEIRKQSVTLFTALVVTVCTGLIFIIFIPSVFIEYERLVLIGYAAPYVFTGALFYSLYRQSLLDFKSVIARSFFYILLTSVIFAVYVGFAFIVRSLILNDEDFGALQTVSSVLLTLLLLVVYPALKSRIDRITNRVFFRDSYDSQVLLSDLNQTLVRHPDLSTLLEQSAKTIQNIMRLSDVGFYVRSTQYLPHRVFSAQKGANPAQYKVLTAMTEDVEKEVFIVDSPEKKSGEKKLRQHLRNLNIEILIRIVNTTEHDKDGAGYFYVGAKQNGLPYNQDDLKVLRIIANELSIAIESALRFEEIEQFNVTLQKKIDDATRELKRSNDKLKALDEAKDEFVSMASHQLRTPLTSIKGYISMVMDGDAGKVSKSQEKMLGQAFFSSQRMVYLISDLLNVSRLRTGKFVIDQKPVYLPDLVETELLQLREGAQAKDLTLAFTKPQKFTTLNLDEMKIRQVVMNFADNAIYYTPTGGKITIELKETAKTVEFRVKDTGIGVPKAQQHKLFGKFFRADNARNARPDGTGLGLFMAKKVIIAQGGSVIFDSKEGKGSTFGFSFPKEKLAIDPPQLTPEKS